MENTSWQKQAKDKPLFPDLLWSRPENRRHAGKLLIVGGNLHSFSAPAAAFVQAGKAGAGSIRVALPDATQKILGKTFHEAEFLPSTPSGSFSQKAYLDLMEQAQWADAVLLAGDFGRNSETAILLDKFTKDYKGQLTVAQDGIDYFLAGNSILFSREHTTSLINMGKLQKLAKNNRPRSAIRHSMNIHEIVNLLTDWSNNTGFVTRHADNLVVAADAKVSTTPYDEDLKWQTELAGYTSVWQMQQPNKAFEALTTAIYDYLIK
jgi:hypothetical protein